MSKSEAFPDPMTEDAVKARVDLAMKCGPPPESYFDEGDPWIKAPELERLGLLLIGQFREFSHIRHASIHFAWKKKGGKVKGRATLGKCVKLGGLELHFAEGADWMIWLAADHVRDLNLTPHQIWSLLFHELKHIGYTIDDNEKSPTYGEMVLTMAPHDSELFWDEYHYCGAWMKDLERTRDAANGIRQLAFSEG